VLGLVAPALTPLAVLLKRLLRLKRVSIDTEMGKFWIDPVSNQGVADLGANEG